MNKQIIKRLFGIYNNLIEQYDATEDYPMYSIDFAVKELKDIIDELITENLTK